MGRSLPTLTIRAWPGAEPWMPSAAARQRLASLLSGAVTVELVPRASLPALWRRDFPGQPMLPPYAFRAYARGAKIVVLVDKTETPASVLWLLGHELAHTELTRSKLLRAAYRSIPKPPGYMTDDDAHEAHPEEQAANLVADRICDQEGFCERGLDRRWWRARVERLS